MLPTLTLFGLGAIAWTICDHILTRSELEVTHDPLPIPLQAIDPDQHAQAILVAVEPDADADTDNAIWRATILAVFDQRDANGADAVLRDEQLLVQLHTDGIDSEALATIRQSHVALRGGDPTIVLAAYQAIKQPMPRLDAAWQVVALCHETLLSLAVASQDGNAAAAYRGLESLRRLRLTWFHCAPQDAIEEQLRALASGTSGRRLSTTTEPPPLSQ